MGRVWKFGDNLATDVILPSQFMTLTDPAELGRHILENVKPGFAARLAPGDLIVAGANFGYGSSREHAPLALKGAGIGAVLAKSFARIFYRNCINIGLPVIVSPQAAEEAEDGDDLVIDLAAGSILNAGRGQTYRFRQFTGSALECLNAGGLINMLNQRKTQGGAS